MRSLLCILILTVLHASAGAQSFEGLLQIDYRNEAGGRNAVDVYVKGERFFIKKVFGGCDRYDSYIFDARTRVLSCLSLQSPKTALSLDIDKVLDIYESKQLKPGFRAHTSHTYSPSGTSKKISDIMTQQKKAADDIATYEIWTADIKVNFADLIPILRVVGFWGDAEDENKAILESRTVNRKTNKYSTISVTVAKIKVEENLFKIPQVYQLVDLDKFLVNEYKSPRFGELVKAFTGFTQ